MRWKRGGSRTPRPLVVDLAVGALVLLAVALLVGTKGYFFIDEAALLAQVELRHEGQWTVARPLPALDAGGELVPMARSYLTPDGFAPFAKHPVHVELAALADRAAGRAGIRLLSSVGALAAAASAWLLARRVSLLSARVGFWVTLLISPLVFDAQLLVAHGLAAGVAGAAFVVVDRVGGWARAAGAGALVASGALLRSEFVLLGLALGAVFALRGLRHRHRADLALAACAVGGALGAYLGEPLLARLLAEDPADAVQAASTVGSRLSDAVGSWRSALFGTLAGPSGPVSTSLLFLVLVLVVAAAAWLRTRPADPGPALGLGAAAAGFGATWLVQPTIASGLLVAFPLLAALLLSPRDPACRLPSWTLVVPGFFAGSVLLLQYEEVGGLEWGWRYVAIVLPPVCAWIGVALDHAWRTHDRRGRLAVGLVVLASLLVAAGGLREQRRYLSNTARFEAAIGELRSEPADWFVAADASFGRFAYELSLERDVLTLPADRGDVVDELAARGADRLVVVWRDERPGIDLAPFVPAGEITEIAGGYRWQPFERSSG